MKKVVWGVLALYFLGAVILFFIIPEKSKAVKILSISQNYSRLITDESETLGIVLLYDQTDSFLTDFQNIRNSRIFSEYEELTVSTKQFVNLEQSVEYKGTFYHAFRLDLGFSEISAEGLTLSMENAQLEIIYENDYVFSVPVGNVDLLFDDLENAGHIGLFRLYGMVNPILGIKSMAGFVIGLEKNVISPVMIVDISILSSVAFPDGSKLTPIDEVIAMDEDITAYLEQPDYSFVVPTCPENFNTFELLKDQLFLIPLNYLEKVSCLNRFPIVITYQYQGELYRHLIDDFLFISFDLIPEVSIDAIYETEYRY
jgi:hypothetical protein